MAPQPFLSVLMRTQGKRPATIEEALLSLAAQTCDDFEVILLPHDVPAERLADIRYLAQSFSEEFSSRVHIVPVHGGGRSRPLNVGVASAQGRYVAILDDDDVVFAHWVETYRELAADQPGRVVRAVPAEQPVRPTRWGGVRPGYEVVGRPRCPYASKFDLFQHLFSNQSPPCVYAVPLSAFLDLGIRFDEDLPVLEDWDVLLRSAIWCGVTESDEVTALWRRWDGGVSSTSAHSDIEWRQARSRVIAKLDAHPLLLPAQSVTGLHSLMTELIALREERDSLRSELSDALPERQRDYIVSLEDQLRAAAGEIDRKNAYIVQKDLDCSLLEARLHDVVHESASVRAERDRIGDELRSSASWRVTRPLRFAGRVLRRTPRRAESL